MSFATHPSGRAATLVLGLALAISTNCLAQSQPTPEQAHTFLRTVLARGTSSFQTSNNNGNTGNYITISQITSGGCTTQVSGSDANGDSKRRYIDWSKISDVEAGHEFMGDEGGPGVLLTGAVELTNGSVENNVFLGTESSEMADRIAKAMRVLILSCDPTSGGPF